MIALEITAATLKVTLLFIIPVKMLLDFPLETSFFLTSTLGMLMRVSPEKVAQSFSRAHLQFAHLQFILRSDVKDDSHVVVKAVYHFTRILALACCFHLVYYYCK